jgi:hypothetical protein
MRAKRPGRTGIGAKQPGANGNRGETTQGANGIRGETTRYRTRGCEKFFVDFRILHFRTRINLWQRVSNLVNLFVLIIILITTI